MKTKLATERAKFAAINPLAKIKLYDLIMREADDATLRKICATIDHCLPKQENKRTPKLRRRANAYIGDFMQARGDVGQVGYCGC